MKLITCYSSFKFSKGQLRVKWPYNEMSWEGSMHSTWVWSTRQGGGGCGCCPLPPTVTQHPHISTVTSGQRPRVTYPLPQHKSDLCTAKITFTTYIHVHFTAQDYNRPYNWTLNKRSCKNVGYVYTRGVIHIRVYRGVRV